MALDMSARSHGFVFPQGFPPCAQCGMEANDSTHVNPAKGGQNLLMSANSGVRIVAALKRAHTQPRRSHSYATGYTSFQNVPCAACAQPMGASCHVAGMPAGAGLGMPGGAPQTAAEGDLIRRDGGTGAGAKEGYGQIVLVRHGFKALPNQEGQDADYKMCALCGFGQDDEVHAMKEPGEKGPNGEKDSDSEPNLVVVKQLAKEGDPSATAKDKDPKGGLSAAGRKKFGVKKGVVSYSSASPADKSRWVRWALRFTKTPRPLKDDKGNPTRYALMFHAWGEPVPASDAAVRAVHAKAMTRRGQLGMGDRETAAFEEFHHDFDRDVRTNTCAICGEGQRHDEHDMAEEPQTMMPTLVGIQQTQQAFVTAVSGKTIITGPGHVFTEPGEDMPRELAAVWETASAQNPHFMWMEGRFVEADRPNRNKAAWSSQDLEMGEPTVAHGPLNWLHEERHIIGTIAAAKLVLVDRQAAGWTAETPNTHIRALAPVWRYLYPTEGRAIQRASDENKLWYSMECVSREVACLQDGCSHIQSYGQYMLTPSTRCDHVKAGGNRQFKDPSFLGGAVIIPPVRPGWGGANATVMRQAAMLAERQEASMTGLSEEEAVSMVAQIISYAGGTQ